MMCYYLNVQFQGQKVNYRLIADETRTEFNVKMVLFVSQCSCKTVQFNFMLYSTKRRAV